MQWWFVGSARSKLLTVIEKKILAPDDVLRASLASYQFRFGSFVVCVLMIDTECYVEHLEILKNNRSF